MVTFSSWEKDFKIAMGIEIENFQFLRQRTLINSVDFQYHH